MHGSGKTTLPALALGLLLVLASGPDARAQPIPEDLRFEPVVSGLTQPLGIRH